MWIILLTFRKTGEHEGAVIPFNLLRGYTPPPPCKSLLSLLP